MGDGGTLLRIQSVQQVGRTFCAGAAGSRRATLPFFPRSEPIRAASGGSRIPAVE